MLLGVVSACGQGQIEPSASEVVQQAILVDQTAARKLNGKSVQLLGAYAEWSIPAKPRSSDKTLNPFDVRAYVQFTHEQTGATRRTGLFFDGAAHYKFRFTGNSVGQWRFESFGLDPYYSGWHGQVEVTEDDQFAGFIENKNGYWWQSGSKRYLTPQYLMYGNPRFIADNPQAVSQIPALLEQQGFSGIHIVPLCTWFNIDVSVCAEDSNPDPRTFDALETAISQTYRHGGVVHLWMWGDHQRSQTPLSLRHEGGLNGVADLRLQRYLAARLGPLPGWTMGYGFDLWEWVEESDLNLWHTKLHSEMGWSHLLGGRGAKNQITQISDRLDYASFEQHRPGADGYDAARAYTQERPIFSEDRFRYRGAQQRPKDYLPQEMALEMWRSALHGGIANIWGSLVVPGHNTLNPSIADAKLPSSPFLEPTGFVNFQRFFQTRFVPPISPCKTLGAVKTCARFEAIAATALLHEQGAKLIFHSEKPVTVLSVLIGRPYQEIDHGTFVVGKHELLFSDTGPRIVWLQEQVAQNSK